jgi:hypothetical protein
MGFHSFRKPKVTSRAYAVIMFSASENFHFLLTLVMQYFFM